MSAIPDRVWELLTDEERAKLKDIVNGWRHEPHIFCPSCGASLGVKLKISAGVVRMMDEEAQTVTDVKQAIAKLPNDVASVQALRLEQDFINDAERSGLLKAFEQAVVEDKPTNIPSDMRKHFLAFFRTAAAKQVPSFALDYFKDQYDGRLQFWSSQGVMAVTADGIVRHFVPLRFISGASITSIGTNKMRGRLMADDRDLDVWVKGRFGYVPLSSQNYMDAIRQKNVGKFGAIVQ